MSRVKQANPGRIALTRAIERKVERMDLAGLVELAEALKIPVPAKTNAVRERERKLRTRSGHARHHLPRRGTRRRRQGRRRSRRRRDRHAVRGVTIARSLHRRPAGSGRRRIVAPGTVGRHLDRHRRRQQHVLSRCHGWRWRDHEQGSERLSGKRGSSRAGWRGRWRRNWCWRRGRDDAIGRIAYDPDLGRRHGCMRWPFRGWPFNDREDLGLLEQLAGRGFE